MYEINFRTTKLFNQVSDDLRKFLEENNLANNKVKFIKYRKTIRFAYNFFEMRILFKQIFAKSLDIADFHFFNINNFDRGFDIKYLGLDLETRYNHFTQSFRKPEIYFNHQQREEEKICQENGLLLCSENYYISARKLLIENMREFKEMGYNNIVLEYFLKDQSEIINDWFQSKHKLIPREIEIYVKSLDMQNLQTAISYGCDLAFERNFAIYNLENLLYAMKQNNMEIVGFEDELSLFSLENYNIIKPHDRALICKDKINFYNLQKGKKTKPIFLLSNDILESYNEIISDLENYNMDLVAIHDDEIHFPDKPESLKQKSAEINNKVPFNLSEHDLYQIVKPTLVKVAKISHYQQ